MKLLVILSKRLIANLHFAQGIQVQNYLSSSLEEEEAISKIAKEVNITRQTVYRIKHDKGLS